MIGTPSAEQKALRDAVGTAVQRAGGIAGSRAIAESAQGFDPVLWQSLCDIGVPGLLVPERDGGSGASMTELSLVAEELGAALTPSPLLASVLATAALAGTGSDLLPEIVSGQRIAALVPEGVTARNRRIIGAADFVLNAADADVLLVVADGVHAVPADAAGVQVISTPTVDGTVRLAQVSLDCPAEPISRDTPTGFEDLARIVVAAEQVGAAARCLALTVDYTKSRNQFGRPIGGFQALKHRMADVHVAVESARSAVRHAAAEADPATLPEFAAVARVRATQALDLAAAEMVQLHGGIAITWEHDAHLYLKRAHCYRNLFGTVPKMLDSLVRNVITPSRSDAAR
jgi:alkylation response protein AidB-like acyl-CoA dehydrogenase